MKLRLLGAGTSSGVPRIGNDWGACDPAEPRNRRTRASLLVEADDVRLLVDTSPDLRAQLLDAGVGTVDAIVWTHDHADHTHGIDDVRQIFHARGEPVAGYARAQKRWRRSRPSSPTHSPATTAIRRPWRAPCCPTHWRSDRFA